MRNLFLLIGRVLLSLLFILSGFQTLSDVAGAAGYFERLGLPLPSLAPWGIGLFELIFGLLILAGWQTRIAAVALAAFAISASYIGHFGQGGDDPLLSTMHAQAFWKDIAVAGALLSLAANGPGAWSFDNHRS